MTEPQILYFDIESLPLLVWAWRLGDSRINYDQIHKEIEVACICWAWGNGRVESLRMNQSKYDITKRDDDADREMVAKFSEVFAKADVVIGHNGKSFDIAVLRSRLIKHELPDFVPTLVDDTYLQIKDIGFTSKKLDYLLQYFNMGKKADHPFEMWLEVCAKSKSALDKMVRYCMKDVADLRRVHHRLEPYTKSTLNRSVFYGRPDTCPHCGSKDTMIIRKYKYTTAGKYPGYQCKSCGRYFTIGKSSITNSKYYSRPL